MQRQSAHLSLNYKTSAQVHLETGERVRVWKNYYRANKPEEVGPCNSRVGKRMQGIRSVLR